MKYQNAGFSKTALLFYQCAMLLAFVVLIFVHFLQRAKPTRISERFGIKLGPKSNTQTLWFHAASLGEVKQIEHLVKKLHDQHGHSILITTFTKAGADWVAQNLPFVVHRYAPIDVSFVINKFVKTFAPKHLIVVENEIWPCLLATLQKSGCKITMLNARSSTSRSRRSWLHTKAMSYFDAVTCGSTAISEEFKRLDYPSEKIHLIDSLKSAPLTLNQSLIADLEKMAMARKTWIAASTHSSDEAVVFDALKNLQSSDADTFLIWAPRHMSRVKHIEATLEKQHHKVTKRSSQDTTGKPDVFILDTLGELESALYGADIVYLGGGLGTEGGHNPYEPIQLQKPTLSGPNVENHQDAFDALKDRGLISFVSSAKDISKHVLAAKPHKPVDEMIPSSNDNIDQTIKVILG